MSRADGGGPFHDLWRAHRPFLISLAFRMLGNIGDAGPPLVRGDGR